MPALPCRTHRIAVWIATFVAAGALLSAVPSKLSGTAAEYLATAGIPLAGTVAIGVVELVIVVLLLIPKTAVWGALGAIGAMVSALVLHATVFGYDYHVPLALVIISAASLVLWWRRADLALLLPRRPVESAP